MSRLSNKLKDLLREKLNHDCDVWYDPTYHGGWMFKSPQLHQQRIGFNFKQAEKFIKDFDWGWIKDHLDNQKINKEKE